MYINSCCVLRTVLSCKACPTITSIAFACSSSWAITRAHIFKCTKSCYHGTCNCCLGIPVVDIQNLSIRRASIIWSTNLEFNLTSNTLTHIAWCRSLAETYSFRKGGNPTSCSWSYLSSCIICNLIDFRIMLSAI